MPGKAIGWNVSGAELLGAVMNDIVHVCVRVGGCELVCVYECAIM